MQNFAPSTSAEAENAITARFRRTKIRCELGNEIAKQNNLENDNATLFIT